MGMVHQIQVVGNAFFALFYPNNCHICLKNLNLYEKYICLNCKHELPLIIHNQTAREKLTRLFWGRVDVEHVFSLLEFQKRNQTQIILHQLKYKGKRKLGRYFGELFAEEMDKTILFDQIVPVPLHPKKQRQRGFNQSECIADGLGKVLNLPVLKDGLVRTSYNLSQTKFTKYDRWENVRRIFAVENQENFKHQHVLLVDDVLTTGATLEACVQELLKIEGCKVSIATLAARI